VTVPGYVPPGRIPFLPFRCRSGYELMAHLEKYGLKIRFYDLMDERDIIIECLTFIKTQSVTGAA